MQIVPPAPAEGRGSRPLEIDVKSIEHELNGGKPAEQPGRDDSGQGKEHDSFRMTENYLRFTILLALIGLCLVVVLLSLFMPENPFYVLLGLFPVILTIVVTYILIDKYHMESGFLMVFPMIFSGIFMVLGAAGFLGGLNWQVLTFVNFVCGIFFEAVLVMQHSFIHITFQKDEPEAKQKHVVPEPKQEMRVEVYHHPEAPVPVPLIPLDSDEDVKKFVSSIEDKAKAINAVIGRVYSVKHGGSEALRKKLRIDPEHYNGFNELKDKRASRRKIAAVKLLQKILLTLKQLKEPEEDLFSKPELSSLVELKRHAEGQDKVLDVLAKNDSDPVKTYYDSAVQFCGDAVKILKIEIQRAKESEHAKKHEAKASGEGHKAHKAEEAKIPKRSPLKKEHLKRLARRRHLGDTSRQLTLR